MGIRPYNNFTKASAAAGFSVSTICLLTSGFIRAIMVGRAGVNAKRHGNAISNLPLFVQALNSIFVKTKVKGYGRKASAATKGGFNVTTVDGDDALFAYNGGNYNFALDESGKYPKITLTGKVPLWTLLWFMYEIIYQTDKVMALRVDNTVYGQDCGIHILSAGIECLWLLRL